MKWFNRIIKKLSNVLLITVYPSDLNIFSISKIHVFFLSRCSGSDISDSEFESKLLILTFENGVTETSNSIMGELLTSVVSISCDCLLFLLLQDKPDLYRVFNPNLYNEQIILHVIALHIFYHLYILYTNIDIRYNTHKLELDLISIILFLEINSRCFN